MPARARAFTGVSEAGGGRAASHATVAEGGVLVGRPVQLCSPSGIPPAGATRGKVCDWVRRRLR
jgi:hypothetical protein